MTAHATQLSEVGLLPTTESPKLEAPPDWALRLGEIFELLADATGARDWNLINEAKALVENMQAECIAGLMREQGNDL